MRVREKKRERARESVGRQGSRDRERGERKRDSEAQTGAHRHAPIGCLCDRSEKIACGWGMQYAVWE
jgi:hypothetical protein